MTVNTNQYEIISKEEIYEPTGRFQESGREVIFTKKIVAKDGKFTVTTKSNEPSDEAMQNFFKNLVECAWRLIFEEEKRS
jgi:hypothetical protein